MCSKITLGKKKISTFLRTMRLSLFFPFFFSSRCLYNFWKGENLRCRMLLSGIELIANVHRKK